MTTDKNPDDLPDQIKEGYNPPAPPEKFVESLRVKLRDEFAVEREDDAAGTTGSFPCLVKRVRQQWRLAAEIAACAIVLTSGST